MKVISDTKEWYPVYELVPFNSSDRWHRRHVEIGLDYIEIPEEKYAEYQRITKDFVDMQNYIKKIIEESMHVT